MELNKQTAELALKEASKSNPGAWTDHSRYVAEACKNIALRCKNLSSRQAYLFGLLHDIGRYAGISSEKHLIDGYRYCMERGCEQMKQIRDLQDFVKNQPATITEFDETLVSRLIAKIIVFDDHFTVEFKSGITIDIEA